MACVRHVRVPGYDAPTVPTRRGPPLAGYYKQVCTLFLQLHCPTCASPAAAVLDVICSSCWLGMVKARRLWVKLALARACTRTPGTAARGRWWRRVMMGGHCRAPAQSQPVHRFSIVSSPAAPRPCGREQSGCARSRSSRYAAWKLADCRAASRVCRAIGGSRPARHSPLRRLPSPSAASRPVIATSHRCCDPAGNQPRLPSTSAVGGRRRRLCSPPAAPRASSSNSLPPA